MFLMLLDIAYAMAPRPEGGSDQGMGWFGALLPFILIFVIFYFLLIRPQQRRMKEHRRMIDNLKKGDKVVTSGGIYGVVEAVGTNTATVKIAENVKVKISKNTISAIRAPAEED